MSRYPRLCILVKHVYNLGPYSTTILKNILYLVLQIFLCIRKYHNFWLAKPYGLANQKLCYFQIYKILNTEQDFFDILDIRK